MLEVISGPLLPMPLLAMPLWYALPLIVAISLVHAATRHELMRPILTHALRFAAWVVAFMIGLFALLKVFGWFQ